MPVLVIDAEGCALVVLLPRTSDNGKMMPLRRSLTYGLLVFLLVWIAAEVRMLLDVWVTPRRSEPSSINAYLLIEDEDDLLQNLFSLAANLYMARRLYLKPTMFHSH